MMQELILIDLSSLVGSLKPNRTHRADIFRPRQAPPEKGTCGMSFVFTLALCLGTLVREEVFVVGIQKLFRGRFPQIDLSG